MLKNIFIDRLFFPVFDIKRYNQYQLIMKTTFQTLHHLKGEQAYWIYWEQYYHCKPRLSIIMAIDLNLEIIIDNEGKLSAYRHILSSYMLGIESNKGQ